MKKFTIKKFSSGMIAILSVLSFSSMASAHEHPGYSHDKEIGYTNSNWMSQINDSVRFSDLSIPGTHDTMSTGYGGDIAQTQSMSLQAQLDVGIRYIDIRCRYTDGLFAIHHGSIFLHTMFGDVLNTTTQFLDNHPGETIFMRVKQEHSSVSNDIFNQTLKEYMDRYPGYFFDSQNRTNTDPTLEEMRGKIVILLNVGGSNVGLNYPHDFNIQDDYNLPTNWDLHDKWLKVKTQLNMANTAHQAMSRKKFINYLSGSGGTFPYFVASGHSNPATGAPRLATGLTTPGWSNSYLDFPRVDCFIGICTIPFEGTNVLTTNYIAEKPFNYTGIVVSDFPGRGLINNVISVNKNLSF
ncbi:phosphatidylinositol-specific phospholipase C [Bacillus cereus]|nr:phosphatidylinositol-specific phospholipase C [Bacillus cereus]